MSENQEDKRLKKITRDNYIEDRLLDQIVWYDKKSSEMKKKYLFLNTTVFTINTVVPVILVLLDSFTLKIRLIITLLVAIANFSNGLICANKYQELWINYRFMSEQLTKEKILFETKVGKYKITSDFTDENIAELETSFICTCESIMGSEHNDWSTTISTEPEKVKTVL